MSSLIYMAHLNMCDGTKGGTSASELVWGSGTLEMPFLGFGYWLVPLLWSQDHGMWELGGPWDLWSTPRQLSDGLTEDSTAPQKEASLDLPP